MGYRDETDALRAKVAHLEDELAVLKGRKRAERDGNKDFAAKVRRQRILLIITAVLGTLGGGTCIAPTMMAAVLGRTQDVTADVLAGPGGRELDGRRVHLTTTLSTDIIEHDYDYLIPDASHPEVLYYCGYRCPLSVAGYARITRGDQARGNPDRPLGRELNGRVHLIESGGYGFYSVPASVLRDYAEQTGVPVEQLRVIELDDRPQDEFIPLIVVAVMFALFVLALWAGVVLHRVMGKKPVDLPTSADIRSRDPAMTIVLSIVTCGLYELYWQYVTTQQIRRLTGRPDLMPLVDVIATIATFSLWRYWVAYRNAEAVDEAMADLDIPTTHRSTALGLALGTWVCSICHWILVFKLQEAYNALFLEKMSGDDL